MAPRIKFKASSLQRGEPRIKRLASDKKNLRRKPPRWWRAKQLDEEANKLSLKLVRWRRSSTARSTGHWCAIFRA